VLLSRFAINKGVGLFGSLVLIRSNKKRLFNTKSSVNRLTVSMYYQVSSMAEFYALARKTKKSPKKPSSLFFLIF